MNNDQIDKLITKSKLLFNQKSLEAAKGTAEEALALSQNFEYSKGKIKSQLLLGIIHMTDGRYKGDQTNLNQALSCLKEAHQLNDAHGNGATVDILLAFGEYHQREKQFSQAGDYYIKALDYSIEKGDVSNTINALSSISELCIHQNEFNQAENYANQCLDKLKKDKSLDISLKAKVYNQLIQVFIKRQEYEQLLEYSEQLLELSQQIGDVEKEVNAIKAMAIFNAYKSDFKVAMQFFLEALEKSEAINFRSSIAHCLINIATIYANFFNYRDALTRYEKVITDFEDVLDDHTLVIIYNNVGQIHLKTENYESAVDYFEQALKRSKESNYTQITALSLAQLSRTKIALKAFDEANEIALKAQELITDLGNINGRQINLLNLGYINFEEENYNQAIKLASQGIVVAKQLKDNTSEILGYQLLAKIYKELDDFEKALQYQMIFSQAQEDYAKEQRNRQILDMEIKHAIKSKQKEIEQLTKENEYQGLLLQQSDQIAKKNSQLLQVNEELRQFAYVASHDLKEPLRMIGSYTQLIEKLHAKDFDESSKEYFAFVSEGVIRMNNLLDALLKYATIGKTEEEREEVKLSEVVEIAIINLRLRIEESNAIIRAENLPVIHSTQSLLIQLFQNLISNAIKFRKSDAVPEIEISSQEKKDKYLISVKDNGIGIDEEYQKRIFIIFQRLHTRNQYEGTGIGLAICQKIVQHLGGRISVDSKMGEGATFTFSLPKKK